jgi:hypothetical protein
MYKLTVYRRNTNVQVGKRTLDAYGNLSVHQDFADDEQAKTGFLAIVSADKELRGDNWQEVKYTISKDGKTVFAWERSHEPQVA